MTAMFQGTFAAWRAYDDLGGEAASGALANQDTNFSITVDSNKAFQMRTRVDETGGADGDAMDDFQLLYSKNSGSFIDVPTVDSGDGIRAVAAGLTNDANTTNRSSEPITDGSGTFVAGEQSDD